MISSLLYSLRDIKNVEASVVAIRKVLDAINTEKAKDEEEDKLLSFQRTVSNWLVKNGKFNPILLYLFFSLQYVKMRSRYFKHISWIGHLDALKYHCTSSIPPERIAKLGGKDTYLLYYY